MALPSERAFSLFADELGRWWPPEYTWSQAVLDEIGMEPRVGGLCFERGPHGFRCDWGRVIEFEPPERLVFTWQISPRREPVPDPAKGSEVEVTLRADGDGTAVVVEHRGFERHGAEGAAYGDAMASEQGWPYILARYSEATGTVG